MNCVFVCYVDPESFVKGLDCPFSQKEVNDIAELVDESVMNDLYFRKMLKKYDNPFWYISSVYDKIKLEIHADMSETDSKTIAEEFNDKVAEVVRNLYEKEVMN